MSGYTYVACFLALVNTCLASVYLSLRHRDGQSDSRLLPTWQTITSAILSSLLLLIYILTILYKKQLHEKYWAILNRIWVMIFLIAFYVGITWSLNSYRETMECIPSSIRCNIEIALVYLSYASIVFGVADALYLSCCEGGSSGGGGGDFGGDGGGDGGG
ncbi:MAG: hypothetical protein J3R72DRAFT_159529 [Linnemannia gamsii]|nr:MAG: hypothetical protein J3R72DRAFT_159529 [Linnemannia gamsii]